MAARSFRNWFLAVVVLFGLGWTAKVFTGESLPVDNEDWALWTCGKAASLFRQEQGRLPRSWEELWQPSEDFADLRARVVKQKGYRLEDRYFFPEKPLQMPHEFVPGAKEGLVILLRRIPQVRPCKPLRPAIPYWQVVWISANPHAESYASDTLRLRENKFQTLLTDNQVTLPGVTNAPAYDPVSAVRLPASDMHLWMAHWWPVVYGGIVSLAALILPWMRWKDARPAFFYTALSFSVFFTLIAARAVRGYVEPFNVGVFLLVAIVLALACLSGRSLIRWGSVVALAGPIFLLIALTIDHYWVRRLLDARAFQSIVNNS